MKENIRCSFILFLEVCFFVHTQYYCKLLEPCYIAPRYNAEPCEPHYSRVLVYCTVINLFALCLPLLEKIILIHVISLIYRHICRPIGQNMFDLQVGARRTRRRRRFGQLTTRQQNHAEHIDVVDITSPQEPGIIT